MKMINFKSKSFNFHTLTHPSSQNKLKVSHFSTKNVIFIQFYLIFVAIFDETRNIWVLETSKMTSLIEFRPIRNLQIQNP